MEQQVKHNIQKNWCTHYANDMLRHPHLYDLFADDEDDDDDADDDDDDGDDDEDEGNYVLIHGK